MSELNVVEMKRFAAPQLPDATKKALQTGLQAFLLGVIWVLGLVANNLSGLGLDPLQVAGISAVVRVAITFLTAWSTKVAVVVPTPFVPTPAPTPSQIADDVLAGRK